MWNLGESMQSISQSPLPICVICGSDNLESVNLGGRRRECSGFRSRRKNGIWDDSHAKGATLGRLGGEGEILRSLWSLRMTVVVGMCLCKCVSF